LTWHHFNENEKDLKLDNVTQLSNNLGIFFYTSARSEIFMIMRYINVHLHLPIQTYKISLVECRYKWCHCFRFLSSSSCIPTNYNGLLL